MLPDLARLAADHVLAVVVLDAADAADEILLLGLFFGGVRGRTAEEEGHEVWVGCFREVAG